MSGTTSRPELRSVSSSAVTRGTGPHPLPRATAIEVRGLDYEIVKGRRQRTGILAGIELAVAERDFVSIVGPSGCGKSTLLNFIAGLTPIQGGHVSVFGRTPGEGPPVGYVFQQHGLLPWRTIGRNVELGLEVGGVAAAERRERAAAMLAEMGLAGFEGHLPGEVSGGMRQRASLARTLVTNPHLILMDEPFGALDAQTKIFIQDLFTRYWETHRRTVLFVTHDLAEAVALSDRVLVMSARPGRIIAEHPITLPRPRSVERLRNNPRFVEIVDRIWEDLRAEAAKSMEGNAR